MQICFQKDMKEQHYIIPLVFDNVRAGMAPEKTPPPSSQQVYGLVLCKFVCYT